MVNPALNMRQMKKKKFRYCVVHFFALPYETIADYVCIPWSWVRLTRKMDRQVLSSYPVENPSVTEKRVKKRQRVSDDWRIYRTIVKYDTDSYEDAQDFIKERIADVHDEYKRLNKNNEERELSKKKKRRSKRKDKLNVETDVPHGLVTSMVNKNDGKSAKKQNKMKKMKISIKTETVAKPAESGRGARFLSSQASECSNHQEEISIQKSFTKEIPVENFNHENVVNETVHFQNSTQNRPSVIKHTSEEIANSLTSGGPLKKMILSRYC